MDPVTEETFDYGSAPLAIWLAKAFDFVADAMPEDELEALRNSYAEAMASERGPAALGVALSANIAAVLDRRFDGEIRDVLAGSPLCAELHRVNQLLLSKDGGR